MRCTPVVLSHTLINPLKTGNNSTVTLEFSLVLVNKLNSIFLTKKGICFRIFKEV
ncbi:MAG: hypothetical protein ACJAU0_002068 [Flavobacteriales bacterium]|jgi:hypothetical protein